MIPRFHPVVVWLLAVLPCAAQVPGILSHQGRLAVAGTNFTGVADFKFALVTTNTGVVRTLWSHDNTSVAGGEPTGAAIALAVTRGVYSVNLGDGSLPNMTQEIPASLFTNAAVYLRAWVNDGVNGSQLLTPDRRLTAVGYALVARTVLDAPAAATNFTGSLTGDVTGSQGATVVGAVGGVTAANAALGANAANAATNINTPNAIVRRDASGDFLAGRITGAFAGDGALLTNLPARQLTGTAPSATNFTGALAGDVTGSQGATVVATVGALSAANVALGANAANAATNINTPNAIVRRDASGDFLAGRITGAFAGDGTLLTNLPARVLIGTAASATNFTAPLLGDVTGAHTATVVSLVGGVSATGVAFGANRANAATPTNELGTIVRRDPCDASFVAGTISARFVGDGSGLTNLPTTPPYYGAPAGAVLVSLFSPDPTLVASGYRQFMSTTVPAWVNGSTTNAPTARAGHSTVWNGQAMIVWGGNASVSGSTYLNSGGQYDPSADSWSTLSAVNVPTARAYHTAVWADTQMIVWGGKGTAGNLGTGARYNPSANTWTALATSGAPSARMGHVAVWTGSKMLVWGGIDSSGLLNDGALYDPALNLWTALSLTNAPEARMNAVAVWAGDRMVVWGGTGESGELGTGGQLVFSNSLPAQWLATTTTGAPYPRIGHTAVWTGDR